MGKRLRNHLIGSLCMVGILSGCATTDGSDKVSETIDRVGIQGMAGALSQDFTARCGNIPLGQHSYDFWIRGAPDDNGGGSYVFGKSEFCRSYNGAIALSLFRNAQYAQARPHLLQAFKDANRNGDHDDFGALTITLPSKSSKFGIGAVLNLSQALFITMDATGDADAARSWLYIAYLYGLEHSWTKRNFADPKFDDGKAFVSDAQRLAGETGAAQAQRYLADILPLLTNKAYNSDYRLGLQQTLQRYQGAERKAASLGLPAPYLAYLRNQQLLTMDSLRIDRAIQEQEARKGSQDDISSMSLLLQMAGAVTQGVAAGRAGRAASAPALPSSYSASSSSASSSTCNFSTPGQFQACCGQQHGQWLGRKSDGHGYMDQCRYSDGWVRDCLVNNNGSNTYSACSNRAVR